MTTHFGLEWLVHTDRPEDDPHSAELAVGCSTPQRGDPVSFRHDRVTCDECRALPALDVRKQLAVVGGTFRPGVH